ISGSSLSKTPAHGKTLHLFSQTAKPPPTAGPSSFLISSQLMKLALLLAAAVASAQTVVPVDPALAEIAATHRFLQTAISPDGSHVAYIEALATPGQSAIYIAPRTRVTADQGKAGKTGCGEHAIAWSSDSHQVAFLSDCAKKDQLQLYVVAAGGGPARQLTHLQGLLAEPRWSPDGKRIAILYTENL